MNNRYSPISILIPAYNPDEKLFEVVNGLVSLGFVNIVVVNDGSESPIQFEALRQFAHVHVVSHSFNRGKGAALKTGFKYVLEQLPSHIRTIITVDADGQHLCKDVARIAEQSLGSPDALCLGVRSFDGAVPLKSEIGNRLTSFVLEQAQDIKLSDTQTGLRAYPVKFASASLETSGEHYEFELNCILLAGTEKVPIVELPISTVYIENNESSHFKPILDSLRVYSVFSRYLLTSSISFALDFVLFYLLFIVGVGVFGSTIVARTCSAVFNFLGNKYLVFASRGNTRSFLVEASGYLALAGVVAVLSASLVALLYEYSPLHVLLIKIIVDIFLFFVSYFCQKVFVFGGRSVRASVP